VTTTPPAEDRCGKQKPSESRALSRGWNLLRCRPLRALVLWAGFPYLFQTLILGLFLFLAILGWGRFAPEGVHSKLYAKTNLVNLLTWGVWWPVMIWVAVLLGRVWCAVCPLELVTNGAERLGRKLGVRQRRLGRWFRSGSLIFALYALIQMLVAGVNLHRVPAYTSIFLWGLLATAGLIGFFFKDRAFCYGFCPVGLLLSTYGRGGMVAIRSEPAADGEQGDCRDKINAKSCPSLLNPSTLDTNTDCLLCGQCVKACQPRGGMSFFLRPLFYWGDARKPLASWPVALFIMLVSGFVTYELCSEWKAAKAIFLWLPTTLTKTLGMADFSGWIKGVCMLFIYPPILWLMLGLLVLLFRGASTLGEAWRRLALPLAVVVAAGHMAKALAKFTSWSGYLPFALQDPTGVKNAVAIADGTVAKPVSLLPISVVSAIGVLLLLTMLGFALRESRLADPTTHRSRIVPITLAGLAIGILIFGWAFF